MDSFTGSSSKVDVLINDIINGDNLDELFKKADYSDDDTDDSSISECDTIETIHEQDLPTPEANDYDLINNQATDEDEDICMNEERDNNTTSHTEEGINAEVQCADIHCVDNNYIFDENDDEDEDDGWIYDEETGYWIQQDVNANDVDDTLETDDNSYINLQPKEASFTSEVNEDNTEREDYVENKIEVDNTHGNILEGQCDNKSEVDEELNNCAEPFIDKDEEVAEEKIAECCTLSNDNLKADIDNEIHEEDEVFVSDNIVSQDGINEVPKKMEDLKQAANNSNKSNSNTVDDQQEEGCQESINTNANPKLVHRKLKISVSVTSNDQVNCENNIQSDPVSLDESEYIFTFYIYIVFQSIIFYTLCI